MVYDCEEIHGRCKCLKINTSNMLIQEILSETTSSGAIAIGAVGSVGKMRKRPNPSVFGTTKTKKKNLDEIAFLAPAVWTAARVAAPWLLKQGWRLVKGTSKVAVRNPKTAVAVGAGVAYKDEITAVTEYLKGIGETIDPILKYAKQYALPVMAVFALLYGGKKIVDMVKNEDPETVTEGEERSIIRDAAVDYLVDMFGGDNWELYADTKEEAEEKLYSELEILDIDEIIDPNMEVGGQRIGNFASGRVIDVVDSNEVIKAVSARLV